MEQKKHKILCVTIVLGIVMLAVTSCNKDDAEPQEPLLTTEELQGPLVTATEVGSYQFINKVSFTKKGDGHITRFQALMPIAQTNLYQRVDNVICNGAQVLTDKNYGNQVLYTDRQDFPGNTYELETIYNVHPIKVKVDVSQIKDIKPYDPNSEPCKRHLGDRGEYIVTTNPYIVAKGDELWKQSSDLLDYARRCYEFVAKNFRYIKGPWRTLDKILKDGGGECGDFSTLVVNLLRYKGIPSRHNLCLRLDGGYHVWVDFYLEGYDWIPLDAQYKNGDPKGDYFGVYDGACVVVMQDFCYDFGVELPLDIDLLQTYYYWYWGDCEITSYHDFHKKSYHYSLRKPL